jgi:hypothetical protein
MKKRVKEYFDPVQRGVGMRCPSLQDNVGGRVIRVLGYSVSRHSFCSTLNFE